MYQITLLPALEDATLVPVTADKVGAPEVLPGDGGEPAVIAAGVELGDVFVPRHGPNF